MRQRLRSRMSYAKAAAAFVSVAVILAVVALVALTGAKAAGQGQPQCGDTITTDTTLHHDLVNCPNNGIIIGADDITLDLNYHRIDGDGMTPAAGCDPDTEFCDVGVLNDGHDGVAVVHGSVRQFGVGVWSLRASHNRFLGISSSGNACCGLGFFRGTRSVVRNSSGSENDTNGMFLIASHHVRILHNSFRGNGAGIFGGKSTHNQIKRNLIARNHEGILMEGDNRNQITGNRFVRNRESVIFGPGSRNVITRNRVFRGGNGIEIENGHGNLVARNLVIDPRGTGISLGIQHPLFGGQNNVVRRNRVKGSGEDGFLVNEKDDHSLLKGNVAKGARDDGFDVNNRTTKLTNNRAVRNADLGIEAVRGVIDGGGNRASGNGDLRQCTNIVCR
jgi:parallel beta-helix repeat protein